MNKMLLLDVRLNKNFGYWLNLIILLLIESTFLSIYFYMLWQDGSSLKHFFGATLLFLLCGGGPLYLLFHYPSKLDIKVYNNKLAVNFVDYELKHIQIENYGLQIPYMQIKYRDKIICKKIMTHGIFGDLLAVNDQAINSAYLVRAINELKNGKILEQPIAPSKLSRERFFSHKIVWLAVFLLALPWLLVFFVIP